MRTVEVEEAWIEQTTAANNLFNSEKFEEALAGYKRALARAENLNDHIPRCLELNIPVMQVYIISCNNLSTTYQALNKPKKAGKMLKRSIHYLLHLSQNDNLGPAEIQNELRRAFLAYSSFIGNNKENQSDQQDLLRTVREEVNHSLEKN